MAIGTMVKSIVEVSYGAFSRFECVGFKVLGKLGY